MPDEFDPSQAAEPQSVPDGAMTEEGYDESEELARLTAAAGAWEPPSAEEAAALFPGYEVLQIIGRGGMGVVYQARQASLDRLVAIKLLPLEVSTHATFAGNFQREARIMARLHHPNIIAVHDFGQTAEGHLFFVMEYVEGQNLHEIIHDVGLEADQALSILVQICTALSYAHAQGIVHRDIKPGNVMIDTASQVKVADFGLARLAEPGSDQAGAAAPQIAMGTPDYVAPEQYDDVAVDHRADIYALGVVLYEMLCREVPSTPFQPPSAKIGCDVRIDAIVVKAIQPQREQRYQSAAEMKADAERARLPMAQRKPVTGRKPVRGSRALSRTRPGPAARPVAAPRPIQARRPGTRRAPTRAYAPPPPSARSIGLWLLLVVIAAATAYFVLRTKAPEPVPPAPEAGDRPEETIPAEAPQPPPAPPPR